MKVLFDTNVLLDQLLDRKPFAEHAEQLIALVEAGKIEGYIGATTVTTLDYLLKKSLDVKKANSVIKTILKLFEIAPVNRMVLEEAVESRFADFEDAVLCIAGLHSGVQAIVTRDETGFRHSQIAVYSPELLLNTLSLE